MYHTGTDAGGKMSHRQQILRDKTSPPRVADPFSAADFDQALRTAHAKYTGGEPLTRRELAALINSATKLMREAAK